MLCCFNEIPRSVNRGTLKNGDQNRGYPDSDNNKQRGIHDFVEALIREDAEVRYDDGDLGQGHSCSV